MLRSLLGGSRPSDPTAGLYADLEVPAAQELVEGPMRMPSIQMERVCFICLDDNNLEDDRLLPCCTQCCAMVHQSCWVNWRGSQSAQARRSRVSGIWSTSDPFMCSICKSGAARLENEIVSSRWLESFIDVNRSSYTYNRHSSGLFLALSRPRSDSDMHEEGDDDMADMLSLLSVGPDGRKAIRSAPIIVLIVTILFIFGQIVVWRVMNIDSQFLVLALTVTICSALGIFSSIALYNYQQKKYQTFITV